MIYLFLYVRYSTDSFLLYRHHFDIDIVRYLTK